MATEIIDQITRGGGGFGFGGGGGGMLGGLLIGALLGNNGGLFGGNRRDGGDCVNQSDLNGQTLGDIKAAIPLAEAQVQLALAGNQSAITQLIASVANQLQNGQTALLLQSANQTNQLQQSICDVDTNVDRTATATQAAVLNSERRIADLITNNRISDLEQQLTVAQLRESEQRSINREQSNSHNVTVTMNQAQAQQQQQMQALQFQFAQLCSGVNQFAKATNSQVVVGSTGVAGTQTANPTNVAV